MQQLHLPVINLPSEFVSLLKFHISSNTSYETVADFIKPNRALNSILDIAFKEFGTGGPEKLMTTLGWSNFRDRMGSVYIYKSIYGNYPTKTNMELVEDIKSFEMRFTAHTVHGYSRLFLLGFYLKLANLELQTRANNKFLEIRIPNEINAILKLSQGRSKKIDWLILVILHLIEALGEKMLMNSLVSGKKFDTLYEMMSPEASERMHQNLLAYGASIKDPDLFLYEKV